MKKLLGRNPARIQLEGRAIVALALGTSDGIGKHIVHMRFGQETFETVIGNVDLNNCWQACVGEAFEDNVFANIVYDNAEDESFYFCWDFCGEFPYFHLCQTNNVQDVFYGENYLIWLDQCDPDYSEKFSYYKAVEADVKGYFRFSDEPF